MKTIYYAFIQKLEISENATEQEIDKMVCQQLTEPVDYIWSDEPDLFGIEKF